MGASINPDYSCGAPQIGESGRCHSVVYIGSTAVYLMNLCQDTVMRSSIIRPIAFQRPSLTRAGRRCCVKPVNAVKEIFMPALSSTMTEGKIVSWLKNPGDKVAKGESVVSQTCVHFDPARKIYMKDVSLQVLSWQVSRCKLVYTKICQSAYSGHVSDCP